MNWPGFVKKLLLDNKRLNQREADLLKRAMLADHTVDREEAAFLVDLKRSAEWVHPDFDRFLFEVLRRVVLRDGAISDQEALWLRGLIVRDGKLSAPEAVFLADLKAQAKSTGPEFDRLYRTCLGTGG
jgi:hypothetical protein